MMETKRPSIHRGQYPTFLLENKPALCSSHHTHYTHTRRCRLGNCCVTTAKLTHFIPFSPINPPSHIHLTRVIQPPPWPPYPTLISPSLSWTYSFTPTNWNHPWSKFFFPSQVHLVTILSILLFDPNHPPPPWEGFSLLGSRCVRKSHRLICHGHILNNQKESTMLSLSFFVWIPPSFPSNVQWISCSLIVGTLRVFKKGNYSVILRGVDFNKQWLGCNQK